MKPNAKLLRLTLILLSLNTTAYAASSEEVLAACDRALNAKIQEASLCDLGVKLRDNELERVSKENAQLRDAGRAWYNNGFLWGAIGVIAGAWAGARAVR